MENRATPKVTDAAIRLNGVVHTLPRPNRHCDIIRAMGRSGEDVLTQPLEYGFMLDDGRFVDRIFAKKFALRAEQVLIEKMKHPVSGLYTDDLW